jgi:hypothetical protein
MPSNSTVHKDKVQFRNIGNTTFSDMNSTSYRKEDERYLYIIPEGSDITSEELHVAKINLTDYVRFFLLPKDHLIGNSAKILKMGPYEKLEFVKPSMEMQYQVLRMMIEELEKVIPKYATV